jgi:hypothetical protein
MQVITRPKAAAEATTPVGFFELNVRPTIRDIQPW